MRFDVGVPAGVVDRMKTIQAHPHSLMRGICGDLDHRREYAMQWFEANYAVPFDPAIRRLDSEAPA